MFLNVFLWYTFQMKMWGSQIGGCWRFRGYVTYHSWNIGIYLPWQIKDSYFYKKDRYNDVYIENDHYNLLNQKMLLNFGHLNSLEVRKKMAAIHIFRWLQDGCESISPYRQYFIEQAIKTGHGDDSAASDNY